MKYFIQILLLFVVFLYADTEYADPIPSIDNPRQIVFAVSDDSKYALDHILSISNNVLKFYGPEKVEMKIVAYSKGLKLLYRSNHDVVLRVDALMQYGVEFVACGTTMRTYNIKKEDLIDGSVVVTSGVIELLESVKAGSTYIKP